MTILAFAGFDAGNIDVPSKFAANYTQEDSSWKVSSRGNQNIPASTYFYEPYASGYKNTASRTFNPTYGVFDSTIAGKELWLSFAWLHYSENPNRYQPSDVTLAQFFNWNGTRKKLVADIILNSSQVMQLRIYSTAEGNNTVTYTQTLRAESMDTYPYNASNYLCRMDMRIVLDPVAGYVQLYDYLGTKQNEFLGRTIDTMPVTDFNMNITKPTDESGNVNTMSCFMPVWVIAADENTMNFYLVPLVPKALGGHQDQLAGGLTEISGRKAYPYQNGSVSLQASSGETKRFSVKLKDMTDKALPANYSVKAVKFCAIVDASAQASSLVDVSSYLRKPSTNVVAGSTTKSVVPNADTQVSGKYQKVFSTFTVNPFTGNPWAVSEFADLEFGVSVSKA